jgi:hypothetical protein
MLRVARSKDREGRVSWRLGYSDILESESAEFAVMSGHVAQVFTEEDAWLAVLRDLHGALVPGGLLAFESRNPGARKWESWTRELTLRTVETPEGPVGFWHETAAVDLPLVSYDTLTRNLSTGEATSSRDVLAFRDERALRASTEHAGFEVDHVYGDWDRTPPALTSPELIMIAHKPWRRPQGVADVELLAARHGHVGLPPDVGVGAELTATARVATRSGARRGRCGIRGRFS